MCLIVIGNIVPSNRRLTKKGFIMKRLHIICWSVFTMTLIVLANLIITPISIQAQSQTSSTMTTTARAADMRFSGPRKPIIIKPAGDVQTNNACYTVVNAGMSAYGWVLLSYRGWNWLQGRSVTDYRWYDYGGGMSKQVKYYVTYGQYIDNVWIEQGNVISGSASWWCSNS